MSETATIIEFPLHGGPGPSQPEPRPKECLVCYVNRMVETYGCSGLHWATRYRDLRAPRATRLEQRLEDRNGYCDCEILMNSFEYAGPSRLLLVGKPEDREREDDHEDHRREGDGVSHVAGFANSGRLDHPDDPDCLDDLEEDEDEGTGWPDPFPDCLGVRKNSTKPCLLWRPQRLPSYY